MVEEGWVASVLGRIAKAPSLRRRGYQLDHQETAFGGPSAVSPCTVRSVCS